MTDSNGEELITQSDAAELRGMSLAAVNQHVRSGNWRSVRKYGKRLVYRADVVGFDPKTHKLKHAQTRKATAKRSKNAGKKSRHTRATKARKSTASP